MVRGLNSPNEINPKGNGSSAKTEDRGFIESANAKLRVRYLLRGIEKRARKKLSEDGNEGSSKSCILERYIEWVNSSLIEGKPSDMEDEKRDEIFGRISEGTLRIHFETWKKLIYDFSKNKSLQEAWEDGRLAQVNPRYGNKLPFSRQIVEVAGNNGQKASKEIWLITGDPNDVFYAYTKREYQPEEK